MSEILDARGVIITPGDTAIWGFDVGRSVAMAEGVVLGAHGPGSYDVPGEGEKVSLTASGRVRVRVIRRSHSSGEKPVVDIAPDRLVVLKESPYPELMAAYLPPSPLPPQDEVVRADIERRMTRYTKDLRAEKAPDWWSRDMEIRDDDAREALALAGYALFVGKQLAELRLKLKALDETEI